MPPLFRRLVILATVLTLTAACTATPPSSTAESAEEREEFRQEMLADMDKVETFRQKTSRGTNLSEFNLGWFTMILLNELSSHDQGLYDYLHVGEMNVELYLRNSFQADPQKEIAIIGGMAEASGSPIRLAARHALEMLTQIPGNADTPAVQAQTRKDLTATLTRLKSVLAQVAEQAAR